MSPITESSVAAIRYSNLTHDVIVSLFNETVEAAHARGYLSGEHFSVDGTLIQAWAGQKLCAQRRVGR